MGSGINNEIILVLIILCLTSGILISASVRVDLVAILVLVTIGLTGLLPPNQLFSGFSSEASISLIGVMIISYSLDNAGITVKIARWILKFGNNNPRRTSTALLIISGFLSSILRSLGTVSLFLPVANRISKRLGISKSSLLMPMAFCALLGGTLTTVGSSPMLILNSLLADAVEANNFVNANISKFKLFDIFPIGLLLLFVGVLYLTLVMPKLDEKKSKGSKISHIRNYFKKTYNKGGEVFELRVLSSCTLIGKCLREFENEMSGELSVIAIHSKSGMCFPPLRCTQILRGQDIAIMGKKQLVVDFAKRHGLQVQEKLNSFAELLHSSKSGLSESVIPPSSQFVGQEVRELHMRRNHALNVLALLRGDKIYTGAALDSVVLRTGDTLGMYSQWQALNEFREQPDFVVITTSYPREKLYLTHKIPQALFCFLLSIALVIADLAPLSVSLLAGALGMVVTGVITIDQAYESVSWRTVFLIAGLLPLGLVMQTSGTANWLINLVLDYLLHLPIWSVQLILSLFTTIMALVISNIGATILMVPLALNIGVQLNTDPKVLALIVALSACNTFLIPTHQVNALIAGPGGYKAHHFLRYGGMMTILFTTTLMISVNWYYP